MPCPPFSSSRWGLVEQVPQDAMSCIASFQGFEWSRFKFKLSGPKVIKGLVPWQPVEHRGTNR